MGNSIKIAPRVCIVKQGKGKIWSVRFYDSKRQPNQKWITLNTKNQTHATAKAYEMARQWESGKLDPWNFSDIHTSIESACRHFLKAKKTKTASENVQLLRRIGNENGIVAIAAVTSQRIADFIYQPSLADATKWSYYNKINAIISWLTSKGYFTENPMASVAKPKEPDLVPRYFNAEELERFLDAARIYYDHNKTHIHTREAYPLWYRDAFELLAFCGLRKEEAQRLNWGDIIWPTEDEPGGIVVVQILGSTKNLKDRVVTMVPRAERVLRFLQENTRNGIDAGEPVLKNATRQNRVSGDYLSRKFTRVQKFARLKPIGLHGLRHTYAAYLRRAGVPIHIIKEELGHQDIATTMKYGKIGTNERMRTTIRLWRE